MIERPADHLGPSKDPRPDVWQLLDSLAIGEVLVLEEIFVDKRGPSDLPSVRRQFGRHGLDPRGALLCVRHLEAIGILTTVESIELYVNRVWRFAPLVDRLLALFRARYEPDTQASVLSSGPGRPLGDAPGSCCAAQTCRTSTSG